MHGVICQRLFGQVFAPDGTSATMTRMDGSGLSSDEPDKSNNNGQSMFLDFLYSDTLQYHLSITDKALFD